jgi:hypothetical protein
LLQCKAYRDNKEGMGMGIRAKISKEIKMKIHGFKKRCTLLTGEMPYTF